MGSASTKIIKRRSPEIQFLESTKMPTAKDEDTRKRNSLMFFMRDWQGLMTFEQQEASMTQVTFEKYIRPRWILDGHTSITFSHVALSALMIYR